MWKQLTKLIDVKSIVTIALTILFIVLAIKEIIDANAVMTIYTTVIAFYFGTQYQKNQNEKEDKEEK
jgi:succinate-acetate transporter protein